MPLQVREAIDRAIEDILAAHGQGMRPDTYWYYQKFHEVARLAAMHSPASAHGA